MARTRRTRRLERAAVKVNGERLYTLSQVADQASLTVRTLQNHVQKGLLSVRRIGPYRRVRVTESERRRYLAESGGGHE